LFQGEGQIPSPPRFSPDGQTIVFSCGWFPTLGAAYDIEFLTDFTGLRKPRVTWLKLKPGDPRNSRDPSFTPDGNRVVCSCGEWIPGSTGDNGVGMEIVVMNFDGTNRRLLTHNQLWDEKPAYSPSGEHIAFVQHSWDGTVETAAVYLMNAEGSSAACLTSDWLHRVPFSNSWDTVSLPSFSPDGRSLTVSRGTAPSSTYAESTIYIINTDGSGDHILTQGSDPQWVQW